MLSRVGLEGMNSTNPDLKWKTVTKGRRSRKSVAARNLNGTAKVGDYTSPKRVGDFSESDSDKTHEVVRGQPVSGKSESVPIKKRRHLLQSPLPHPCPPSMRRHCSASPQISSPSSEDQEKLLYFYHQKSSNGQLHEIDESTKFRFGEGFHKLFLGDQTKHEYNDAGEFSGIELLAAAASMDDFDDDNANKQDIVSKDSLMSKNSNVTDSATQSKADLESKKPENSSSNMFVHGVNSNCSSVLRNSATAFRSVGGSAGGKTMPTMSRQHWDLNYPIDALEEPYSNSVAGNASKDVDHSMKDENFNLKIEANKMTTVSSDTICDERPSLEKHAGEPSSIIPSNAVEEISDQAGEGYASNRNTSKVSKFDAHTDACNQVMTTDSILYTSPFTKPSFSSGVLMSEEKINLMAGPVARISDEYLSSNVREIDRITASGRTLTRTQDITALVMPTSEIPHQSPINIQCKDKKDFQKISELPGTFIQDGRLVLTAESKPQMNGNFIAGSTITDLQGHLGMDAHVSKHEDKNLANESTRNMTEDSSKSYSPPTASVGKIGSTIDGPPNSDISQKNLVKIVDGVDLTGFQEGYDSPYEDGELRGSLFYSWEDKEMENECIDYESDGRNGDDCSDAADYLGSEIFEGGSEGSHCAVRSSLSLKGFPEGKNKGELAKCSVKDDSVNNEMAGKGSKAGSGTTVEQSIEMLADENYDAIKRSQLTDQSDAVGVKLTRIDEYESKTARRKIYSCTEGRSCMDAADGKDGFMQQCRSRRGGSYYRSGRGISPDNYMDRYSPAAHGERDGVHHFTKSWGSRSRYTSSYQGPDCRPQTRRRSKNGDFGFDFHDPTQSANYLSKGLHRRFMRRSPVERDDYFCQGRRMPPTRGVGNYRGRGHYSECGGRGSRSLVDEFEPLHDDVGPHVRIPCYFSKRDRSFSPSPGRNFHLMPLLPRRKSRSRSRTRSPKAWNQNMEQQFFSNHRRNTNSRSPEFRPEGRMERMRVPFLKPGFQSDYRERGHVSPQHNPRWVDGRSNFVDYHNMRRRISPPVRVFRRNQRFDAAESSERFKSHEYFKPPVLRSRRFSFTGNGGRECKLESGYADRRRDDGGEVMQWARHCDDGGNMRRYPNNAVNDFENSDLNNLKNNEDDVPRDVNQSPGDGENKGGLET